jgi:hypothetical protein
MPSKIKPLPLHVSHALIERERADVIRRTQRRIAQLRATENSKHNDDDDDPESSYCTFALLPQHFLFLFFFCFCVLLVIMNLLFLKWLYYEVRNSK